MNEVDARLEAITERERALLASGDTSPESIYELSQIRAERELLDIRRRQLEAERLEAEKQAERDAVQARIDRLVARAHEILKSQPKQAARAVKALEILMDDGQEAMLASYRLSAIQEAVKREAERAGLDVPRVPGGPLADVMPLRRIGEQIESTRRLGEHNWDLARRPAKRAEFYENHLELVLDFIG